MKIKFGLFSLRSQLDKDKRISGPRLLARLLHDEEGAYLLYMTLTIPILLGLAALGTEGALLTYYHRQVQSAADAAAYSAAVSYSIDGDLNNATTQAQAIVANYSFVVGTGNNQANVVAAVELDNLFAINRNQCYRYAPATANLIKHMGQQPVQRRWQRMGDHQRRWRWRQWKLHVGPCAHWHRYSASGNPHHTRSKLRRF